MKKIVTKKILILICLIVLFVWVDVGRAANAVNIVLVPQNPVPGTQVTARVESLSFDVDRSDIVWKIGGVTVSGGAGDTSVKFIAPEKGKSKDVTVYITSPGGSQFVRTVTLVGNDVDLLWEALTYVPAWYRGKALPVREAKVKVSAIPFLYSNGKILSSKKLLYEWFVDYKKDFNSSGMGKDSFVFKIKNYDDQAIIVHITSQDGSLVFKKVFRLSADGVEPKIVFYEENPLEGARSSKALKESFLLERGDIRLRAEPYFFSLESLADLSYTWTMNSRAISPEGGFDNILSLRAQGEGASLIKAEIMNMKNVLQSAQEQIRIIF